jgi:hypothetical protein
MRRFPWISSFVFSMLAMGAVAQTPSSVLPQSFAGWNAVLAKDAPASATPEEAAVLTEYGLAKRTVRQYAQGNGDVLIRAWQFKDATGAFGAFTFYRQPAMKAVALGKEGAAAGDHFVFWNGTTVVDATFVHPAKDELAALSALADTLPKAGGAASVAPSLPHYLPSAGLDAATVHYAIGPAAYAQMGGALPASEVDFSQDAEAVTAEYGPAGAQATLTLVMYPTPQIAGAHLKAAQTAGLLTKRSGPLLAVVSGSAAPDKAQALLDAIQFNDYVTINHPEGYVSEGAKLYHLLYGITVLTMVLVGAAVLLGIFLGGGRAMLRVARGKSASALSEEEFISLHLE